MDLHGLGEKMSDKFHTEEALRRADEKKAAEKAQKDAEALAKTTAQIQRTERLVESFVEVVAPSLKPSREEFPALYTTFLTEMLPLGALGESAESWAYTHAFATVGITKELVKTSVEFRPVTHGWLRKLVAMEPVPTQVLGKTVSVGITVFAGNELGTNIREIEAAGYTHGNANLENTADEASVEHYEEFLELIEASLAAKVE
ncbi:MAG: hypothetical protein JWO41_777 [Candidatus Saccharibacteria bacterium]|nr:hypothetical protein [Candidatus Saccharibacteria bacterium]